MPELCLGEYAKNKNHHIGLDHDLLYALVVQHRLRKFGKAYPIREVIRGS